MSIRDANLYANLKPMPEDIITWVRKQYIVGKISNMVSAYYQAEDFKLMLI